MTLGARSSIPLWIFLLGFTIRLIVLLRFADSIHFLPEGDDMKFYSDWAQRIAAGTLTDHRAFYGLPGYAYLLAPFFKLLGGLENPEFVVGILIGLLQSAMDAGIAVLLFQISRLAFAPESASVTRGPAGPEFIGIAAALAWIFFVPAQTFSVILMPTVWLLLTFHVCLLFLVKTSESTWQRPWLVLGICCGISAMLVATVLFLIPLMLVSIFLTVGRGQSWRVRTPKIAFATLALIGGIYAGASPAWIHNYFIAREPVMLSAHSGINFWIGNNPTATGYPRMPPGIRSTQEGLLQDSIRLAEEATGRSMARSEVSKYWSERASDYISHEKFAWLRLLLTKFENFWNAYQYDDLSIIKLLNDEGVVLPGLRFGPVAALGLAGFLPVLWKFPRARWIGAAVLLHMAAVLTVFVTERYRLAAVPGLMILGAGGLWIFWNDLLQGRWTRGGLYLVGAFGAAWFVSIPRADIGLWSLDHYKAGIRATEAGDLDRAQRNLETAFAYVQENADINFALGNLWLARADLATEEAEKVRHRTHAKVFYRRALELNPRHASTLNNLGVLAFEEKRYELAEQFLTESLAAESGAAKTHFLLAQVRFAAGKIDEARGTLDEALRLQPKRKEFLDLHDKLRNRP